VILKLCLRTMLLHSVQTIIEIYWSIFCHKMDYCEGSVRSIWL